MTPPPALVAYLRQHGVDAEFVAPGVPMPSVPAAAAAIGAPEEQIIKTLLFQARDGHLAIAIAAGTAKIDRERLAQVSGLVRPRLADADTVKRVTGYPAGGVPPVGHTTTLPVVVDRRAASLATVYGGGGVEDLLLRVRIDDILRLTNATVADITITA